MSFISSYTVSFCPCLQSRHETALSFSLFHFCIIVSKNALWARPTVRSVQPENQCELNLGGWFPTILKPPDLVLHQNTHFPPGYKYHCFCRSRIAVQYLLPPPTYFQPINLLIDKNTVFSFLRTAFYTQSITNCLKQVIKAKVFLSCVFSCLHTCKKKKKKYGLVMSARLSVYPHVCSLQPSK